LDRRTNSIARRGSTTPTTPTGTLRGVLAIVTLLLTFALAFGWSLAQASGPHSALSGPLAQATNPPGDFPTVPVPVASGQVPQEQPSAVTGTTAPGGNTSSSDSNSGGGFPWLIVVIVLVVVVIGAVATLMLRPRRPLAATGGSGVDDPSRTRPMPTGAQATAPTSPTVPAPRATPPAAAGAATTPIVVPAPVNTPTTLTCPNCSAVNDWNENFCHDCGQDLRPVRAAAIAAMAPPTDVVTDDMPYLETLDRSDEQLEYVLSRARVVIGSAAGCDIMVDKAFVGGTSVAPRHAQLTRNPDGTFSVMDLGAPSGTFVNDTRVDANGTAPLSDGAQIRVGSVRFVYRIP
jgi:hypothetical protein